jgi:hypothetical protein
MYMDSKYFPGEAEDYSPPDLHERSYFTQRTINAIGELLRGR